MYIQSVKVLLSFLDNVNLSADFSLQLTFRTSSRDGLLFLMLGNSTSEAGERFHKKIPKNNPHVGFPADIRA